MIEKLKQDGGYWVDESDCSHESPADFLQTEVLGFCGCGNPSEVMEYVRQMLLKLNAQDFGDYEDLPYMFFVYWANDKEFAEHGTTARCSWLTDKGKELLRDIETVSND